VGVIFDLSHVDIHLFMFIDDRKMGVKMFIGTVGFTTTYAISAYHHKSCEFEPRLWRGVLDTTLCDKVCQ
jgi:hypothetical protein